MSDHKTNRFIEPRSQATELRQPSASVQRQMPTRPIEADRSRVRATQGRPSQQQPEPANRSWWIVGALGLVGVIVIVSLITLALNLAKGNESMNSTTVTTTITATSPSVTQMAAASDCPDSLPVFHDPHVDMNAVSGGLRPGFGGPDTLKTIETQPEFVAYALNGFFPAEFKDPPDWKQFVTNDGKCFSTKGLLMQERLKGALTSKDTKVEENVPIPTNLVNTGIGQSGPVANSHAGIPSGRTGVKYTFANGQETYVDYHCANIPKQGVPQSGYTITEIPATPVVSTPVITTEQPPCFGQGCYPPPVCTCENQCVPEDVCFPPTTSTPPPPPPLCPNPEQEWPICKDGAEHHPGNVVTQPQRPNPLPATPNQEEPSRPTIPSQTVPYSPPPSTSVVVNPTITQTPSDTPRTTQPKPSGVPTAAPTTTTNPGGTVTTTRQGSTTDLSGMG